MPSNTRFDVTLGPLRLIWLSLKFHYHALRDAIRKDGIISLLYPQQIRNAATANMFIQTSAGFIAYEDTTCVQSLVQSAHGKVLELGPGPGNQLQRFNTARVDFIYAVEPSPLYADNLALKVRKNNLQDKYKLITCGIEDSDILASEGIVEGSMDTILSIQVLCAVKDVRAVMKEVWRLLKPGGSFIFWEHVQSKDSATALTQAVWNPAWKSLAGCSLTRDVLRDVLAAGEWENASSIEIEDDPYTFLPRIFGELKKKA